MKGTQKEKEEIELVRKLYEPLTISQCIYLYHKQKHSLKKHTKHYLKVLIARKLLYQNPKIDEIMKNCSEQNNSEK